MPPAEAAHGTAAQGGLMATWTIRGRVLNRYSTIQLVLAAVVLMPCVSVGAQGPELSPELQKVRAALEKYQDPIVAVHDGYRSTLGCVEFPHPAGSGRVPYPQGGMGIHFANARISGPVPDPVRPKILIYEPEGDKFRLV